MYLIKHLNVVTSSFCDLKCSYCYLHKNKSFREYDKKVIESWKDGTYIENLKKVFKKLNSDPHEVHDLALWGGEPFIHIDIILDSFKELMQLCPNLDSVVVPTNWLHTNIDNLCKLLQIVNDNIRPRKDISELLHFHIQPSIDGIEGDIFMRDGHFGSWKKYKDNFDELCDKLEQMYLPNLSIDFCISGTATQQNILTQFSDYENIKQHIQFWNKAVLYAEKRLSKLKDPIGIANTKINFPTIAIPQVTSSIEALDIVKTIKTISQTFYNEKAYYGTNDHIFKEFFNCESDWPLCRANHECPEADQKSVTILPDGTICQCPDGYLENTEKFQNEFLLEQDFKEYKNKLIASYHFFNPLTASEKEIQDHKWYMIMGGFKDTFFPYISLGFATAQELALSHQIDEIYLVDPMLLLKHLTAAGMINECFRESCDVTGVPYMGGHDMIRRWFNGYLQEAYNFHLHDIKQTIHKSISHKINRENL